MSYIWNEASAALLRALGFNDVGSEATSVSSLDSQLRGRGVELVRLTTIQNVLPYCDGMLGALLEKKDGSWMPILGGTSEPMLLSADGSVDRRLVEGDLTDVVRVVALKKRQVELDRIAPFLLRYKSKFIDLFACALIINLFALTLPLFSSFVYDKILGNGITDTLWALVIGLAIVAAIEFCVRILRISVAERFSLLSEVEIDLGTFRSLLNAKMNELPSLGTVLEKYKQILSYRDFLSSAYLLALADLPFLLLFLAAITVAAGPLVLVSILCGGLILLFSFALMPPVLSYERDAKQASEKRFGIMTDVLVSREAIVGQAFRQELEHRWRMSSMTAVDAGSKARYWRGMSASVMNSISNISFVSLLVGGVYLVDAHQLTSGGLLAASMLTSRSMSVFASVSTLVIRYREFRTALRELDQLVPPVKGGAGASAPSRGRFRGALRVDKVTCRLQTGGVPILKDVSFSINPGEIVGIAGAPGAGKTTLLRMITGSLNPDEGHVLLDNVPLEHVSEEDLGLNIGFKPQDLCLIEGSIEDNVRAGRPSFLPEQRDYILTTSGLFRAFQENGLNWATDVGARGSKLSGGQRQLVSLARALAGDSAVLVLDEPTNGLDAPLEKHLADQVAAMRGKRTVIVSTHSRSMLSICDRIIVVGQSRILADGPREKIMVG